MRATHMVVTLRFDEALPDDELDFGAGIRLIERHPDGYGVTVDVDVRGVDMDLEALLP